MRFSKDYSKLDNDRFTTIRRRGTYYISGRIVNVVTPTKKFKAEVLMVESITKEDITEELAQKDADCSRAELIKMLERWYGKSFNRFELIHLKKWCEK